MTCGKTWVKISKVMPQPKSIPQGREGSLTAKSPNLSDKNMIWFNCTHSFLNLQTKIFNYVLYFGKFPAN